MIKFLAAPPDVVAVKVDKIIEADELKRITDRIDARLDDHETIAMYLDLRGLERLTLAALLDDLRYTLGHLRDLQRVRRVALVTQSRWMQAVASWEGRLLEDIDLRVFPPEDRTAALDWACEDVKAPTPSLHRLRTTHDSVRAFVVDGPLRAADVRALSDDLETAYARHDTIRLLVRIEDYGVRPSAFTENLLQAKLKALQRVDRYAMVGGPDWVGRMVALLNPLMTLEVKHVARSDEPEAWDWLGAEPIRSSGRAKAEAEQVKA